MTNEITEKLKQASDSLLMMSESEYPFKVFLWSNQAQEPLTNQKLLQLTGHSPETSVEEVELDYLFRNCAQEKEWHDKKLHATCSLEFLGMGNGEWGMGKKLPVWPKPVAPSGSWSNLDHPRSRSGTKCGDGVSRRFR